MKKSEWNEGLNHLDSDIVEAFVEQKEILSHKKRLKNIWLRAGAVAACLALIISAAVVAPGLNLGGFQNLAISQVPILEDGHYSAKYIASIFNARGTELDWNGATNAYTKVYAPNKKYLYINEIPDDEYLDLYKNNTVKKQLNEQEFKEFTDEILPKISTAIGIDTPKYSIDFDTLGGGFSYESLDAVFDMPDYNHPYFVFSSQYETYSVFAVSPRADNKSLYLNGKRVEIDQRLSDEEIIISIEPIKYMLFNSFGVSFSDTKVIRDYGGSSEYGAEMIDIYFYNEAAHSKNSTSIFPLSDYIRIRFDNFKNHSSDKVSDSILTVADIFYCKVRIGLSEKYELFAKAKRIPLEEAEELLYKGYVFGGHSCPLCMAAQEKVDFEGYDLVGLEYVGEIPFYAFYKDIGTAKNGNTTYAKTYVPAIKISGYEEYFESQKANHK